MDSTLLGKAEAQQNLDTGQKAHLDIAGGPETGV